MSEKLVTSQKGKPKPRSPAYPSIDLKTAISRAETLYQHEKGHITPVQTILKHWGYGLKSGPGRVTLAAMKYFGLLNFEGSGAARKAQLTNLSLDIILDQREDATQRSDLIKKVALLPPIHAELWSEYNGSLPSNQNLMFTLQRERGFTERGAEDFLAQFRSSLEYAKLTSSDYKSDDEEDKIEDDDLPPKPPKRKKQFGMNEDTFTLEEGQAVIQWPDHFSQESFEDFEGWVNLILRKAKRAVNKEPSDAGVE